MFLDAYKRNWLETEGYSFEDKMIDDLSVRHSPYPETHISQQRLINQNRVHIKDLIIIHAVTFCCNN